jgi:3-deoxy-D-manno-octulosonate 8-phosphate phosphatase (KDO 8-P phosphatase)
MKKKAKNIKLVVLDVDGTLTDGGIAIDNNGVEAKIFNVKDGFAIAQAIKYGLKFAIITGRESQIVEKRSLELKIEEIHQGVKNKMEKLDDILDKYGVSYEEVAYMGDDVNDIPAFIKAGFTGAPQDATTEVYNLADFRSRYPGGKGAVREFVEYILREQEIWEKIVDTYKNMAK